MAYQESIQRKIRFSIVSFTAVVSVFLISLLVIYAWVIEDNIFNRLVSEEAGFIKQQYQLTGEVTSPRIPFMTMYGDWSELPESVQILRQQSPTRIEFPLNDGGAIHVTDIQLGNATYLLAANVSSYEISKDYLPKLLPWIALILLGTIFSAFTLARYLARQVVQPLQHIASRVVSQQSDQPLQFTQSFANDEIGYLAQTISSSFNRLQEALQREADFSRDISHELRTPVAVLKLVAGRLNSQAPLDEASISRVKSAIFEVEQSLVVLLALSREESVETQTLSLLQEVEHCVINHFSLSSRDDVELNIAIAPTYRISCNRNLLHILLNNLLDNVVNHASKVALSISLVDDQLVFSNPVNAVLSEDVLSPQVKGQHSDGLGQGLHLVKRICEKCGWSVEVSAIHGEFTLAIQFK